MRACASLQIIAAAALALGAASTARAQGESNPTFQAFTKSPFYAGLLNRELASLPADVFQRCPGLVSRGSQVTVLKPVTFAADGFPNGGVWKQSFPVSGCGNDTVLNFYFQATPAEKIDTLIAAPGDTHADPVLQGDARRYATIAAQAGRKDCAVLNIKTTKFEGYPSTGASNPDQRPQAGTLPWRETWTMVGCGHSYTVPLNFIPAATGTQIVQPGGVVEQ